MLSFEEQSLVVGLLADFVAPLPNQRAILCSPLPPQFALLLPDVPLPKGLVEEAIKICIADSFNNQPTWLERLLDGLLPGSLQVAPIVARLRNPPPATAVHPLDVLLLSDDAPFFNRGKLRQRLRVLSQPNAAKPILVVSGPTKSGKTYSAELIDNFCRSRPGLILCQVRLPDGQEEIIGARDIASDLVAQLGPRKNEMPPVHTNEDRWTGELATWVLSEAMGRPGDWWFLLDGFNRQGVRADARKFIAHLADQVTKGIAARHCRLILLDFDRTALSVQPTKVLKEEIEPVEPDEVAACVDVILKRTGTSADVQQVVDAILQGLPTDDTRLPVLNQRLSALLEEAANV